jgi:hypothetical protein
MPGSRFLGSNSLRSRRSKAAALAASFILDAARIAFFNASALSIARSASLTPAGRLTAVTDL